MITFQQAPNFVAGYFFERLGLAARDSRGALRDRTADLHDLLEFTPYTVQANLDRSHAFAQ